MAVRLTTRQLLSTMSTYKIRQILHWAGASRAQRCIAYGLLLERRRRP